MTDSTTPIRSNFIPDGYTTTGYIAERPGLYYESRFKYRVMLHGERNRVSDDIARAKDSNTSSAVVYRAIEKQLVEWDQINRNGEPVKPTAVNIAHMSPMFVEKLFSVVCGFGPSDNDPATQAVAVPERDELERLLEGGPAVADGNSEADAKN